MCIVNYDSHTGHFAICEKCFKEISLEKKIYYYTKQEHIKKTFKKNIIENILKECNIDPEKYYREQKLKKIIKSI